MGKLDDARQVAAETPAQWRAWLAAHHDDGLGGAWLVSWKKATGKPAIGYEESVEQALCYGWVDSTQRTVDAERTQLYFAPRKPRSGWSRPNKIRVARLEEAGLMAAAGAAVIAAAKADGSWSALDDVEDGVVPPDLAAALAAYPDATANWDGFPKSVRRGILEWISTAQRPQTRQARVAETARLAETGERANQWRPR